MTYPNHVSSKLAAFAMLVAALTAHAAHAAEGPTEDSLWYYEIGGAQPVSVPANPGVNPSLTIVAMTERAMSKIPAKDYS